MKPLKKLVGVNDYRPTRFHTERRELLPLSAWATVPVAVYRRVTGRQPETPWMAPAAIDRLDDVITKDFVIFEFGAGASTAWFAERAKQVYSVESDEAWVANVRARLADRGLTNCEITLADPDDFPALIAEYAADAFDLVIVDGYEKRPTSRVECVEAARSKVKPGGYLVLDNSDRANHQAAFDLLSSWVQQRFLGYLRKPLMALETTIFQKPGDDTNSIGNEYDSER